MMPQLLVSRTKYPTYRKPQHNPALRMQQVTQILLKHDICVLQENWGVAQSVQYMQLQEAGYEQSPSVGSLSDKIMRYMPTFVSDACMILRTFVAGTGGLTVAWQSTLYQQKWSTSR